MTEGWQIFLLVVVVLATIYFIGFGFCISRANHYRRGQKEKVKAINVLLTEKREVLLALLSTYSELGVPLDSPESKAAEKVRWAKSEAKDERELIEVVETYNALQKRLSFLAESHPEIKENRTYEIQKSTLDDLDMNYRRIVALFNHDIVLYDYWRRAYIYRLLFKMLTYRKIERLP